MVMQTFLPYPDLKLSAQCLDRQRLGKQRVEVLQLLQALTGEKQGWCNHPATYMWSGHASALAQYGLACCTEWIGRGYKDTCYGKIERYLITTKLILPFWFGNETFHSTHRSVLLAKHFEWYKQFGWLEMPATMIDGKWPYAWPVTMHERHGK
jgi:hypothetical protein